jgi:glycosyltransferase involved in cell wall biosynthesis
MGDSLSKVVVSVVVPVYNEAATVSIMLNRLTHALRGQKFELIIVDDGSNDSTVEQIRSCATTPHTLISYPSNRGKGAALRTGFEKATGEIVVIQDADLEYDPRDIPRLIEPILDGRADIVFGSRFHGQAKRVHLFSHRIANALLTLLSNIATDLSLSDMECGYKAFRKAVLDNVKIRENRFGFEPEITAKVARKGYRIYEVPVSYSGRDYSEGKKIGLKDAFRAFWCIIKYGFARR